jgi:hypothetical protein
MEVVAFLTENGDVISCFGGPDQFCDPAAPHGRVEVEDITGEP